MVYVIYGVSGCGKSTVAKLLSDKLALPFYDADDYHPQANIDKMTQGSPLNDNDRQPWLERLAKLINDDNGCVLACSALKEKYRKTLAKGPNKIQWIHLEGEFDVIADRMKLRGKHFMKAEMLQSQFDTLEKAKYGVHIDIQNTPEKIVNNIIDKIKIMTI